MERNWIALAPAALLGATACLSAPGTSPAAVAAGPTPAAIEILDPASANALRLDRYLSGLAALGFSGAVVVEHEGRVVLRRGYGLADREARRPYAPSTVQTMGSITKQITAAAILLLAERGHLAIENPIADHLSNVPPDKQGITLHHLLTHQSGLPEYSGGDAEAIDADTFLARALELPLEYEPGAGFEYSNVGYSLLGIIIERVSGRGYEQFVRDELLLPAGLTQTGYVLPVRADGVLAHGYRDGERYQGSGDESNWLPDGPGWNLRANGGLRTTVDDMHRWLRVVRGAGPLSPELAARWTATHLAASEEFGIGYGWVIHTSELGRMIMHSGGNPAFSSFFAWLPEHELFMYAQGNTSRWEAGELQEPLLRAWFDPGVALPPPVAADPRAIPALATARSGEYVAEGAVIRLAADDVRLRAELSGQPVLDAMLSHDASRREWFSRLNANAATVMERLSAGRDDVLEGLVSAEVDHVARARSLAQLLSRQGGTWSLALVGSVANVPGTHFAGQGGSATFVRVAYDGGRSRILTLLWRDDGTYRGATMGPLTDVPGFVMVPTVDGAYTAVERSSPWRTQHVTFDGECMVIANTRLCRRR
jgi:CubicO group peptidase (beta-lactamase class C family)